MSVPVMNPNPNPPEQPPSKTVLRPGPAPALSGFGEPAGHDPAAREEIQHRAYLLWKAEGCPEGKDVRHWLDAEVQVFGRGGSRG